METRILSLLDAPRFGGASAKPDMETKAQIDSLTAVSGIAKRDNAAEVAESALFARTTQPDLQAAVSDMNDFVQSVNRNIDFQLDDDSGRVVVSITDRETGGIIRQIPSEEALKLAESLSEARSLLFNTEA